MVASAQPMAALAASQIIPLIPEDSLPNSLGPSSCSSLNSLLWGVLPCFFQNTAQVGSSRHRNILFQLPAHLQQPTARSHSLRCTHSKCSDEAGSSIHSAAQQERTHRFESVKSERKKKTHFGLSLSATIKKNKKKTSTTKQLHNLLQTLNQAQNFSWNIKTTLEYKTF